MAIPTVGMGGGSMEVTMDETHIVGKPSILDLYRENQSLSAKLAAAEARCAEMERERDACREIFKAGTRAIDYDRWIACVAARDGALARADRYEKALRFYADPQTYGLNGGDSSWIFSDTGKRARAALAGGE